MNGHKYLLLGNHDKPKISKQYGELGFEGIFTTPIKIHNKYLSHQPLDDGVNDPHFKLLVKEFSANPNGTNYHGHIHTTEESTKPYYNVICEALGYKPLLIGYTSGILTESDSPLIIDSERFKHILEFINNEKKYIS